MRARYADTSSFDVTCPPVIASCSSAMLFSITSTVGGAGGGGSADRVQAGATPRRPPQTKAVVRCLSMRDYTDAGGGAMHISERAIGDVVIVDVSGKITLGDGGDMILKDKMRSLSQQGFKKVLLNLGDVSYVDSAGLGEIVQSYATVSKNGGTLKLLNVTKRIKDLLSITKLLTVFDTFDNEADAVRSFSTAGV